MHIALTIIRILILCAIGTVLAYTDATQLEILALIALIVTYGLLHRVSGKTSD